SLVQLLLGMSLLHSVRTGSTNAPSTWVLTAAACIPPLLSVTATSSPDTLGLAVHTSACLLAAAAAAVTTAAALTSPGRRAKVRKTATSGVSIGVFTSPYGDRKCAA